MTSFYHEQQRALQIQMKTTRIADRLEETRLRHELNDTDLEIINGAHFFFISSMSHVGLDCSIKSGPLGFVRSTNSRTLLYPDYDGNGMFRTLGNIVASPDVALLFVEFWGDKRKLRLQGRACVTDDPELCSSFEGAQFVVKIDLANVFSNCPRYLPSLSFTSPSEYVEALGQAPLEPAWKSKPDLKDYVHQRKSK